MPNDPPLRPATREELARTLAYALQYRRDGKPHRHAQHHLTAIAAGVLVDHLELAGFVVMKKPPAPMHGAPAPFGPDRRLTEQATKKAGVVPRPLCQSFAFALLGCVRRQFSDATGSPSTAAISASV